MEEKRMQSRKSRKRCGKEKVDENTDVIVPTTEVEMRLVSIALLPLKRLRAVIYHKPNPQRSRLSDNLEDLRMHILVPLH